MGELQRLEYEEKIKSVGQWYPRFWPQPCVKNTFILDWASENHRFVCVCYSAVQRLGSTLVLLLSPSEMRMTIGYISHASLIILSSFTKHQLTAESINKSVGPLAGGGL